MRLAKLILVALLATTPALAQQQAKDRKDYFIEALIAQRDDYANRQVLCVADSNSKIAELQKEIADLKAKQPEAKPKETN